MLTFVVSLGLGIIVGCLYGVVRFKSPAPPPVALVGLAGIILGEWLVDLLRR